MNIESTNLKLIYKNKIKSVFSRGPKVLLENIRSNKNSKTFCIVKIIAVVFALITMFAFAYVWYQHRTIPQGVVVSVYQPDPVWIPGEKDQSYPLVNHLVIKFDKSVAPLNSSGKQISSGIELTPKLKGTWEWIDDHSLQFIPLTQDWPAGQKYIASFGENLFTTSTQLQRQYIEFITQPLSINIKEFKFYQNPLDPKECRAVATLEFNYPIDTTSFGKNIVLQKLDADGKDADFKPISFTISYDKFNRRAYIKSDILELKFSEYYLQLALNKNIKPALGIATNDAISKTALIPSKDTFFKIVSATANIVNDNQNRPGQVISIETTAGTSSSEFDKAVHVYLLPTDKPAKTADQIKKNYDWNNVGEVTKDVLSESKKIDIKQIPTDIEYATLHSYKFDIPEKNYLYISVDKGVKSQGDYALANKYSAIVKVPEYPKSVNFLHSGSILALNSEQKISVVARGISTAKITLARILPREVNNLITQTSGDFNNPNFRDNWNFNQSNISEIFSEIRTLNNSNPGKAQYIALDFGRYLNTKNNVDGPHGLFLVTVQEWDQTKNIPVLKPNNQSYVPNISDINSKRLILVTDLGLLVKNNGDGSHDVFVQSITKGEPVVNSTVEILGKNGVSVLNQITDKSGHVHFPNLKDFKEEREPTVYLAKIGNDVAFIPYEVRDRELNYSRYDIGGITNDQSSETDLTAFLFTERGIYRPGDTIHVAGIVKRPFAESNPAGFPLEAIIRDPRGKIVKDQKIMLDKSGYLSLDYSSDSNASTGQYEINLFTVKDNKPNNLIGHMATVVHEFLPDRMRITSHLNQNEKTGWVNPNNLLAEINLQNLYGTPAPKHRVSGSIVLAPRAVSFSEYSDYIFVDPLLDPHKEQKIYNETLKDTETDAKGNAKFELNLERFDKATYQLTVLTEGFEAQGGRSVKTKINTLVSPLKYLVGYKSDGDLNFIKQRSKHSVSLIAINPQLKKQLLSNLTLETYENIPITTLIKKTDDTYQYQSIIQKKLIKSIPFKIEATGPDYVLNTENIGSFEINIKDSDGVKLCDFDYTVVGENQAEIPKNAELTVKLNKTTYTHDEDIELQITAPYIGAGLITLERDKVYAYKWFKTTKTNSIQTIHIPKEMEGNGYVNVAFVRDFNSPDIFISPLSYSVSPFAVSPEAHNIAITLQTAKKALAGTDFSIHYKTDKPGKIIIFAVDEGILQVNKYKTPDPLGFFFQKHSLDVHTQQILDQILPKYLLNREISAVGGDDATRAIDKSLNPFKRKVDAPVVYWSGIVDSDTTEHNVVYKVPDYFNGNLRVMAIAVAANAVGSASTSANITNHFIINPNTPTFVAPGDKFEVTASIARSTEDSANAKPITVKLVVSDNLEILDSAEKQITIKNNGEEVVRYNIKAKDLLGNGSLKFVVSDGTKTSNISSTLSVRPIAPYKTSILTGYTNDKSKTISIDRKLYSQYRNVTLASSESPLILINGLGLFLNDYPYLCTEQLVSRGFTTMSLAQKQLKTAGQADLHKKVQDIIQLVLLRQNASGGFNYWPNFENNDMQNQFVSIYTFHFLTEAKENGYDVSNDVMNSCIAYLKEIAGKDSEGLENMRLQAYAIYMLTRNEIVTTNYLTHLQLNLDKIDDKNTWHKDIISAYIAATYQLLQNESEANRIIKFYKPGESDLDFGFYSKNITDSEYLYLVARHFPKLLSDLNKNLVFPLIDSINDDSINTLFAANVSMAFSAYDKTNKTNSLINIDEKTEKKELSNPKKSLLFYQLTQQGFDKNPSSRAVSSGIEIFREYRINGNPVTHVKLGDEVEVHIQIRSASGKNLNNVAIVDLLPGGFDVVRDSINEKNDNQGCDYIDAREDRVVFFCTITPDEKGLVYRIKATNAGEFTAPQVIASSMYNPKQNAANGFGKIVIVN